MIRSNGLNICLLGLVMLFLGCAPTARTALISGSPDDVSGCYAIFPAGPWASVHAIDAIIGGGISSSLLGVTKGEPSERKLHSLLLTPEGFILFDAELRDREIAVRKAVSPFDSPAFARGLMEDVALLFLPPQINPRTWVKESDGTMTCKWEDPDEFHTEITGSMESGWRILRRNKRGNVIKEIFLSGPFVNGLASRIELRALEPAPYRLRMTLVQPSP